MVHCDNIFLLSASRSGLQAMVNTCDKWFKSHNMIFSTNVDPQKSKPKYIIFGKKKSDREILQKLFKNGTLLPYVGFCKHLGMNLYCDNTLDRDCDIKCSKFVGKVHSINQELYLSSSDVLLELLNIHYTSFNQSFQKEGSWGPRSWTFFIIVRTKIMIIICIVSFSGLFKS